MNTSNPPRRPAPASEGPVGASRVATPVTGMGVRPGAGVLGLAKADPAAQPAPQSERPSDGTLIVGQGIEVKGEIQSCTTLIVEGKVEASLEASELTVLTGGLFDGTATVQTARVGGSVKGSLTVKGLLTVEAGGSVSGMLRYRDLKIEQGGRITGDIDLLPEEPAVAETAHKVDPRDAAIAVNKAQAQGQSQGQSQGQAKAQGQAAPAPAASERLREGLVAR